MPPLASSPSTERRARATERLVSILLAEDNAGDVLLIREALKHERLDHELIVESDGERMLLYIDRIDAGAAPCPDLVLLDLNLPKKSGEALLARVRQSPLCGHVPVVIVTSSDSSKDREATARLGATDFSANLPTLMSS